METLYSLLYKYEGDYTMADKKEKPNLDNIVGHSVPVHDDIKGKLSDYAKWDLENTEKIVADGRRSLNTIYATLDDKKKGIHRHGDIGKTKLDSKIDDIHKDLGEALEGYIKHEHKEAGVEEAYDVFKGKFAEDKKKGGEDYFNAVLSEFEKMHGGSDDVKRSQLKKTIERIRSKGGNIGELLNAIPELMEKVYVQNHAQMVKNRRLTKDLGAYNELHVQDVAKKEFIDKYQGSKVDLKAWHDSGIGGAVEVAKYHHADDDQRKSIDTRQIGVTYKTVTAPVEKKK